MKHKAAVRFPLVVTITRNDSMAVARCVCSECMSACLVLSGWNVRGKNTKELPCARGHGKAQQ